MKGAAQKPPDDMNVTRLGITYNPPSIMVEYATEKKRKLHKIKFHPCITRFPTKEIIRVLRKDDNHRRYLENVGAQQLASLIRRIKANLPKEKSQKAQAAPVSAVRSRRERLSGPSPLARATRRSTLDDVKKVFLQIDTDQDGLLSLDELLSFLGDYLGYGEDEIAAFFESYREASSGVTVDAFKKGYAMLNPFWIADRKDLRILRSIGALSGTDGGSVQLEELENCEVLLCDTTEQTLVDHCKSCRVLIGPVQSSAFIRDCNDSTFWVACRQLRTRNCHNCFFFLHCHTEPIIETSTNCTIGPWAASYPCAQEQFEKMGFDPQKNMWNAVFDFSGKADKANWRICPLGEVEHLIVASPDGKSMNPAAKITHTRLCAKPIESQGDKGQAFNIPQTPPSLPPSPAPGTKPKRRIICLGGAHEPLDIEDETIDGSRL